MQNVIYSEVMARAEGAGHLQRQRHLADRPDDHPLGHRRAEAALAARHPRRRRALVPGLQRARRPAATSPTCARSPSRDGDEYVVNGQKIWISHRAPRQVGPVPRAHRPRRDRARRQARGHHRAHRRHGARRASSADPIREITGDAHVQRGRASPTPACPVDVPARRRGRRLAGRDGHARPRAGRHRRPRHRPAGRARQHDRARPASTTPTRSTTPTSATASPALYTQVELTRLLNYRALSKVLKGEKNWPEVPLAKLQWSHLSQTLAELDVDLLGPLGLLAKGGPDAVDGGHAGPTTTRGSATPRSAPAPPRCRRTSSPTAPSSSPASDRSRIELGVAGARGRVSARRRGAGDQRRECALPHVQVRTRGTTRRRGCRRGGPCRYRRRGHCSERMSRRLVRTGAWCSCPSICPSSSRRSADRDGACCRRQWADRTVSPTRQYYERPKCRSCYAEFNAETAANSRRPGARVT